MGDKNQKKMFGFFKELLVEFLSEGDIDFYMPKKALKKIDTLNKLGN